MTAVTQESDQVEASMEFRLLPLAQLYPHPLNRKHSSKEKLSELAESLKAKGVLTPLLVRPMLPPDHFQIIAGHRRYQAAKLAGMSSVPCRVSVFSEAEALEVLVIENLQREDVHPLEEAEGYAALLEQPGYDVPGVAAKVGKSESYVYARLKLADLIEPAKKAFYSEKITAGHAILMARLQPKDQAVALQAINDDNYRGPMSVREFQHWIRDELLMELSSATFPKADVHLLPAAGACTTCPKRTGYTPELFAELEPGKKQQDRCLDQKCFQEKVQLHLAKQVKTVVAETGKEPIRISTEWGAEKGILGKNNWTEVKPTHPKAKAAIVAAGHGIGEVKYVSTEMRPSGSGYSSPAKSAQEKAREAREVLERKRKTAGRQHLFDSVTAKIQVDEAFAKGLPEAALNVVLQQVIARMWNDHQKAACRLLGIELKKVKRAYGMGLDPAGALRQHAATLKFPDRIRFLMRLALVPYFDRANDYFTGDKVDQLAATAKAYKLNAEQLQRAGAATVKAPLQTSVKSKAKGKKK